MVRTHGRVEEILRDHGTKVTPQRVAILRAVGSSRSHPDVDAVYRIVSKEYPNISRDTVYRTLAMMEEKKIIGSILFVGNAKRYDPKRPGTTTWSASGAGAFSISKRRSSTYLAPPFSSVERFKVVRTTVHVEGICEACQDRSKAG